MRMRSQHFVLVGRDREDQANARPPKDGHLKRRICDIIKDDAILCTVLRIAVVNTDLAHRKRPFWQ